MPDGAGPSLSGILARRLVSAATSAGVTVATAESLTAGEIASTVAGVPGASAVLRGGLVVYATDLKATLAGVDGDLLAARGPVDPDVARALAQGAAIRCGADIGLGVTGVAGPDSQDGHPVGEVYVAVWSAPRQGEDAVDHVVRLEESEYAAPSGQAGEPAPDRRVLIRSATTARALSLAVDAVEALDALGVVAEE
ncbi:CinA family protein [Corynebacterium sp.]|uniref:CinA family protein n=1 Tax=Corynebacterium sp. TaxID=1720 RepID=UPI0025C36499|nr:CinA family protein [Corynebacterium sp.]